MLFKMIDQAKNIQKHVIYSIVTFNIICEIISLFIIGFNREFFIGIVSGTTTMIVNYILLGVVVDCILYGHKKILKIYAGVLIYGIRLIIFALSAYLAVKSGMKSIIAYAISVLSFALFASIMYVKEGKK